MIRALILSFALLAAPAFAAPYYRAEPAAAPAQTRFVARDNVWRCEGGACVSERSGSRHPTVCTALVREVGALTSFSADGRAFAAEELEACNRRAR
jgi:hypothetical protein